MKVKMLLIALAIILIVMFSIATVKEEEQQQSPRVSSAVIGEVKDENDQPLEGAIVAAGGNRTAITNNRGNYLLSLGNSTKEDFIDILIDKKGFKTQIRTVAGGGIQTLNIVMIRD